MPDAERRPDRGMLAVIAVLVLVLVGTGAVLFGGFFDAVRPTSAPRPSAEPTPASVTERTVVSPDGGEVRVVEQGFSPLRDRFGEPQLSYGLILENTSREWIVRNTEIEIKWSDASGAVVETYYTGLLDLLPGQRIGLGGQTPPDKPGAARMSVTLSPMQWLTLRGSGEPTATVALGDVRVNGLRATYSVTCADTEPETRYFVQVVLRDRAGRIVGGADPGAREPYQCPAGTSRGVLELPTNTPAGTADERTEIYVVRAW